MNQKETILSPIQDRLTALPAALDLTHDQVSAYLGVSPHTLRKWISGERDPGALLLRTLDLLDLVRTLTPDIHSSLISDCRIAAPVRPKGKPGRKTGQKIEPKFPKIFPRARARANLVDTDFSGNAPTHIPATSVDTPKPVLSAEVARKPDPDDVFVWVDDTWCYRSEVESMSHMSDDYRVLFAESPEWVAFPTD